MNKTLIHKLAVLAKDYYVNRTIDDLFIFAGAERTWWRECSTPDSSSRVTNFYGWVEGIECNAAEQLDKIIEGVATQLVDDQRISEGDRNYIRQHLNPGIRESPAVSAQAAPQSMFPKDVEQLLEQLIKGLPRAMFPLKYRRKDLPVVEFDNEYDVQSLFHTLLRPWIKDIRVEEYTPSYAGTSTRIDFLCAAYNIVIEIKFVRDARHGRNIGDELIIDIAHYSTHPNCSQLWIVIFDPHNFIPNSEGLIVDLDGEHTNKLGTIRVRTFILSL